MKKLILTMIIIFLTSININALNNDLKFIGYSSIKKSIILEDSEKINLVINDKYNTYELFIPLLEDFSIVCKSKKELYNYYNLYKENKRYTLGNNDYYNLYLKCCEELSKRYINIIENFDNKVKEEDIAEELNKDKYKENYSEESFNRKIKILGKRIGTKVLYPALLLYNVLQDENVPLETKGTIIAGLGYFICPIDLIADVVPVLGYTDDVGALALTINLVKSYVTPDIEKKTEISLNRFLNR